MASFFASTFFFLTLLPLFSTTTTAAIAAANDPCKTSNSDLSIIHINGKCSPFAVHQARNSPQTPWLSSVINMASKDSQRLAYLSSLVTQPKPTKVPIASGQNVLNSGNYIVRAQIGTPAQIMYMVLDTSNDVAWVPCSGCTGCTSSVFSPNASASYAASDCSLPECAQVRGLCPTTGGGACFFSQSYGGGSFFATLAHDSLTVGKDVVPNYAFGCISSISGGSIPPQGLLGLGRGSMSLLSQSGSLYSGVFSYCLPSFRSYYFSGSLKLGPLGQPGKIKTTPLLKNPHRPSLYYVNFTGISVGKVPIPIAPELLAFDPNTGSGTIIDSGTVITRFIQPIYEAMRDEFRKQVKGSFSSLGAFDTCFAATNEVVAPPVTFHFEGLNLVLPAENSLIHSSSGSLACLSMAAAPNNVNSGLNVIANLQQQNHRILFDTTNSRLGIARELCN